MSNVSGVDSNTTATASQTTSTKTTGTLGKDDFLKLLMAQLTNQDPLKPMDDTAFVSQMAQFSALEQMQNMSRAFSSNQAYGMIGKTISWAGSQGESLQGVVQSIKVVNGEAKLYMGDIGISSSQILKGLITPSEKMIGTTVTWKDSYGETKTSTVKDVTTVNGQEVIILEGPVVGLDKVLAVAETTETPSITQATALIGKTVSWKNAKGKTVEDTAQSVKMINGTTYLVMKDRQVSPSRIVSGLTDPASNMIGKSIQWKDSDGNTQVSLVKSIVNVDGVATPVVEGSYVPVASIISAQNS